MKRDTGVVILGSIISGAVSGGIGFLLDNLSVISLSMAQLATIAVAVSGWGGFVLRSYYYRGALRALSRVASRLDKREKELETLQNARAWDFVEMERVPGKLLVRGGDEEVGVSREYFSRGTKVKVDFTSSAPVDLFIHPDASPILSFSGEKPWKTTPFRIKQPGLTKWSTTFDAGPGYMYAVVRLSDQTSEAEVTIRVSELVPIAGSARTGSKPN